MTNHFIKKNSYYILDNPDDYWRRDFDQDALFSEGSGLDLVYRNNSPSTYYVGKSLDISYMVTMYFIFLLLFFN